ncbi:YicC family protein [candidate division KSB1 bacterium]|nr:YicC family protein [candidate division KSB1 bacterium]
MIISMTGYGRGEVRTENKEINVEVRTLNNRYLDVTLRVPKSMFMYEEEIKSVVRQYVSRGRVNIVINMKDCNGQVGAFQVNVEMAQHYMNLLNSLKQQLHLKGDPELEHLLQFRDIFLTEPEDMLNDETWAIIKTALESAMENLRKMRIDEGQALSNDLKHRISILDDSIAKIELLAKERVEKEYQRIKERIASIGNLENVDEGRLEGEVALLASRMDITEECIRFKSHNNLFIEAMNGEEVAGRKLNFLLQEMTREANTIGAKAYDADIAHIVVDIKEEVEKIREQVQNIE